MKSGSLARLVLGLIFTSVVLFTSYAIGESPIIEKAINPALVGSDQPQDIIFNGIGFTDSTVIQVSDLTNGGVYLKRPTEIISGTQVWISAVVTTTPALWMARAGTSENGPWSEP